MRSRLRVAAAQRDGASSDVALNARRSKKMKFDLEPYLKSHRLNGLVEIEDLAAYCTHHKIQVEYISKQELDASIDPATTTSQCVLESEGGVCIRFTAHTGEVLTIRMSEYLVDLYRSRVAKNQKLADHSKSLLQE